MLCKLQYFFNPTQGKFLQFYFIIFIGILVKIAVFSPCLVYGKPLVGWQVTPEVIECFQVAENISGPQEFIEGSIGSFTFGETSVVFQVNDLAEKGVLEFRGGLIKLLPLHEVNSILVGNFCGFGGGTPTNNTSYQNAAQCTNNTYQCSNDCLVHKNSGDDGWDIIIAQIIGSVIGLILGSLILIFYFRLS